MIPEKIQSFRKILERNNLITVLCLLLVLVSFILNYYNRANEMCTFYKRNVQKKDFFSRQTKSVQSVFEQRLNSRLETQNQTLFS